MFDKELERYFQHTEHDNVLDIGPGEGKFGKMLRRVQPSAKRIAVELEAVYVEQADGRREAELVELPRLSLDGHVRKVSRADASERLGRPRE